MASLASKDSTLGFEGAKHLLHRTTFFVTKDRIEELASLTPHQAVNLLTEPEDLTLPEGPISYINKVPFLTTNQDPGIPSSMKHLLTKSWIIQELARGKSIRQKLAFFNHTLFITDFGSPQQGFDYWRLMMQYANGNLKELAYKVTLNPRMLNYLNNRINTHQSPNENYAREFLELFTIRKGTQIGRDDYTNYTEHDVRQAARVLTGFTDKDRYPLPVDHDTGLQMGYGKIRNHDKEDKTFSKAFGNRVIRGAQSETDMYRELWDFIEMIFDQVETARSFVRRMYRFFVSDYIDDQIEQDIIEPLAIELQHNDYEMQPVINKLLISQHFYDEDGGHVAVRGSKIKSGMEMMFTTFNMFLEDNIPDPYEETEFYFKDLWRQIKYYASSYGLRLMVPDNVEGYGGFYNGPNYSKNWINGITILERLEMGKLLLTPNKLIPAPLEIDLASFVKRTFHNHADASSIVNQILDLLLVISPDDSRRQVFTQIFLGNASEEDWKQEWEMYLVSDDPTDVTQHLKELCIAVMSSPDYQVF